MSLAKSEPAGMPAIGSQAIGPRRRRLWTTCHGGRPDMRNLRFASATGFIGIDAASQNRGRSDEENFDGVGFFDRLAAWDHHAPRRSGPARDRCSCRRVVRPDRWIGHWQWLAVAVATPPCFSALAADF